MMMSPMMNRSRMMVRVAAQVEMTAVEEKEKKMKQTILMMRIST